MIPVELCIRPSTISKNIAGPSENRKNTGESQWRAVAFAVRFGLATQRAEIYFSKASAITSAGSVGVPTVKAMYCLPFNI